ncbi:hypothetical protein GCM10029964_079730 [Kibdelosporangium lantanae]
MPPPTPGHKPAGGITGYMPGGGIGPTQPNGIYEINKPAVTYQGPPGPGGAVPPPMQVGGKPGSTMYPQGMPSTYNYGMGNQAWNYGAPNQGIQLPPSPQVGQNYKFGGQAQIPYTPIWNPGGANHGSAPRRAAGTTTRARRSTTRVGPSSSRTAPTRWSRTTRWSVGRRRCSRATARGRVGPEMTSPFIPGDQLALAFDEHRRLRLVVPQPMLPLAAWLYTDVQPNLSALDQTWVALEHCRDNGVTYVGNGCLVDFVNDVVVLESRYETWPRHVVPQQVFWSVLAGVRAFLAGTAGAPVLARPDDYPLLQRGFTEHEEDGRRYLVDYTYFPADWSADQAQEAEDGAWASPELVRDEVTGLWSGMWQGMELAGYYDSATDKVLVSFPVISP